MSPSATLVQVDPPGPYKLPTALALQGIRFAQEGSPAQFDLLLDNGVTVHLPMAREVFEAIRVALKDQYPEAPGWVPIGE
jgi:hypothetical protein